jgi:putative addiction module component (TIGR02574 family)
MSVDAQRILKDALSLPALERATVAEELLHSLDQPDPRIDELWAREAEDRLAAFQAGQMGAIPAEEVLDEQVEM